MTTPGIASPPTPARRRDLSPADAHGHEARPVITPSHPRSSLYPGAWPLLASVGVHLLAGTAIVMLWRAGSVPVATPPDSPAELVEYIALDWPAPGAASPAGPAQPSSVGAAGSGPPVAAPPAPGGPRGRAGSLSFPSAVPRGLPPTSAGGGAGADAGERAAGGGGAAGVGERLRTGFEDSRLYVQPGDIPQAQKSDHQKYMEHLHARIDAMNDSVYAATPNPDTDWTFKDGGGRKWGLSEKGLHLGGVTVPKEVIPLPRSSGSNQKQEQAREEQRQRDAIRLQEERRAVEEARKQSTKATRARKDEERNRAQGDGG